MSDFKVTLRVTSARLATVLEALKGAAELLSVLPCEEPAGEAVRHTRVYAGGKRDKGVSGQELALRGLARGAMRTDQLSDLFAAKNFARNSVSPVMSELRARGLVEMLERGRWRLTPAGTAKAQELQADAKGEVR